MPIIGSLPFTIVNGTLEDANPVMANYNWILSQVNANAAPLNNPVFTGTLTSSSVSITGGTIDGTVIGGTTPAAITGTSITATTGVITPSVNSGPLAGFHNRII